MDTLIELYGDRALENVLAAEVFRPERIVYLCPAEAAQDRVWQNKLREFYFGRGLVFELIFKETSLYNTDKIYRQLCAVAEEYPNCAVDITGGTDACLFAAGMFCQSREIPAFTYSRRKNSFYNICHAEFADGYPCDLSYSVEDFFRMAGGTMRKGRVDNVLLEKYEAEFPAFFDIYLRHRKDWLDVVTYMQRVSPGNKWEGFSLDVDAPYTVRGERSGRISAKPAILQELQDLGYLRGLKIAEGESVSFSFADENVRSWLRDVGSVLELYVYKLCRDTGVFSDVISSAVVDWDGTVGHDSVSNEIDVVAARGTVPLFISCKTCEIKTEALNELAILAERFGGKGAKAAIVTTDFCNAAARHRAAKLNIAVIDLEELRSGRAADRLKSIMKLLPA